jgi:hypothetical protein
MGYETEQWRRPTIQKDERIVFDEHGRSLSNIDYKSHWFVVVEARYGGYWLLVKHGGGEERISLGYQYKLSGIVALEKLSSDERYLALYVMLDIHHHAADEARAQTAHRYQLAFLEKRLKRHKRNHRYYAEIVQPKTMEGA